jgi:hypothetical protein
MRRSFFAALAACLFLASHAAACLNDREIENQERFFKSSYIEKPAPEQSPSPSAPAGDPLMVYGGIGGGTLLLIGAFAVGLMVSRKS